MNKKIILSSVLAIVLCVSIAVGATFAIFTSESQVNIAVTSGKVKVEASLGTPTTYSMGAAQTAGMFQNGGTAVTDGKTLTLDKLTPGDKAVFQIKIANQSDVNVLYRYGYKVKASEGGDIATAKKLYSGLVFTLGEVQTKKYVSYFTKWAALTADETLSVSVELPVEADNTYQELSGTIEFNVEAVQGNADVADGEGEEFEIADKDGLLTALDSINNATEDAEKIIKIADDFAFDDETLAVKKGDVTLDLGGYDLTVNSGAKDGISVEDGASLTISGGNGKLNVDSGNGKMINLSSENTEKPTKLTIKDVQVDIVNDVNTKAVIYAYAKNEAKKAEINLEDGAEININGARNFGAFQLANNAVMNMNGGVINANGVGSVIVAGRNNGGTDCDDVVFNYNAGTINITGGNVLGIECNYYAIANINGGTINISGDCDDSYAVGASFGGHIYINDGATINVNATSGSAYAAATYGSYSRDYRSTIVVAAGANITLGAADYNGLVDLYDGTDFIDNRG